MQMPQVHRGSGPLQRKEDDTACPLPVAYLGLPLLALMSLAPVQLLA